MFLKYTFSFIILLLSGYCSSAQEKNWELIEDTDGIKVYINSENDKFVDIKAVTYVYGDILSFYNMLSDVADYEEWMPGAEKTRIIEREKRSEFIYYMRSDLPWPAKDRDLAIETIVHYKPDEGVVYTRSKDVPGIVDKKEDASRVKDMKASWRFEKMKGDKIKITYRGEIKPNIWLPDWLEEIVYSQGPYRTLKNIKEYHN